MTTERVKIPRFRASRRHPKETRPPAQATYHDTPIVSRTAGTPSGLQLRDDASENLLPTPAKGKRMPKFNFVEHHCQTIRRQNSIIQEVGGIKTPTERVVNGRN